MVFKHYGSPASLVETSACIKIFYRENTFGYRKGVFERELRADVRLLSKIEKWRKLKDATLGRFRLDKCEAYFSTFRPKNDCTVLTTIGTSIYRWPLFFTVSRSSRQDSTDSKPKKRRIRFPSPPPIIRYQTPFINFLSSQDQPPVTSSLPPPPPPPLSHDWPEEGYTTRPLHVSSDLPFSWERDDLMAPAQLPAIPSMSSSFKVEVNGTLHWRENYSFPHFEPPAQEEFHPQFPTPCWSAPPSSAFSVYEDAQMHMQHYLSRDQFWREC